MTSLTETLERPLAETLDSRARTWIEGIAVAMQEGDDAVFEYDPVSRIEEIEHELRDGFWPWTSGGYMICLPASLFYAWSSGLAPAPIVSTIRSGNEIIAEEWNRQHPERPPFNECVCADDDEPAAKWREAAQEWEQEGWQSDDDCYYWKARIIYYGPRDRDNKSGAPEVYLDAYLCSDSYGRDNISWLSYYPGGKADQTAGNFKLQIPVERFARLTDDQIARMIKTALRRLPGFVSC